MPQRDIQIKTPESELTFEYDWALEVPNGVSLITVTHFAPDPLVITRQEVSPSNLISKVTIAGGVHPKLYVCTAIAELSTGELVPGQFTLRVIDAVV